MKTKFTRRMILPTAALLVFMPLAGCHSSSSSSTGAGTTGNTTPPAPPTAPATPPSAKPAVNVNHVNNTAKHAHHMGLHAAHKAGAMGHKAAGTMGTMGHKAAGTMGAMGNHMSHKAAGMSNHMGHVTKSMTSHTAMKAKSLLSKAIAYVKANKNTLAKQTFNELNKLKPQLPATIVSEINNAERMFKLKTGTNMKSLTGTLMNKIPK